jgi:glycosyltransferase involved in cell wall biosynthesis
MEPKSFHISVCICTFKRPKLLINLLEKLQNQKTDGLFTYSIVIADNDKKKSAKDSVERFQKNTQVAIDYHCEPEQNIALARNKAVRNAHGDFIAFIDDDEFPLQDWLLNLVKTLLLYNADGIRGPVKPFFEKNPPNWIIKGKFYDRESYPTGHVLTWRQGRTGNLLLRKTIFDDPDNMFDPAFGSGAEDQDFFRRIQKKGYVFIYCNEAIVYEIIPPVRWKRTFMLKRALLRRKVALKHPGFGLIDIIKSLAAIFIYFVTLPFLLIGGQHIFMKYLIKLFDHAGKCFAFLGIILVKEKYVTD